MKKLHLGLLFLGFIFLFSCEKQLNSAKYFPAPTETIVLKNNEDSEDGALERELWIEKMHMTAPDQNWRKIELKNAKLKAQSAVNARQSELVTLGDSLYTGYWEEKGSSNQAGSIVALEYLQDEDKIYCISAGGTLWKGDRSGNTWEVVNQSYKFDDLSLMFIDLPDDGKRLIATIARIPHYSDDKGLTWETATGIESSGDFWSRTTAFEHIQLADGSTRVYCMSKFSYSGSVQVYYSDDLGLSYNLLENTGKEEFQQVAFCKPHGSNDILIGTSTPPSKFKLEKINHESLSVDFQDFIDVSTPHNGRITLIGNYNGQDSILYAVQNTNSLRISYDAGKTWENSAPLANEPWDVGFYVAPSNASKVFYGNVEAFRKIENTFPKVNDWWEYYDDVPGKLHADIMSYAEFVDPTGDPFLLIGNHGGLSISYNYMQTNENISLEGLNVAQYYDVRTDPNNPNIVYAGSQDQGFQRAINFQAEGPVAFEQVISGDYGHITFSREGQGMWIVYPGGSISYYSNPQSSFATDYYDIESENESNWLPPMTEIPGTTKNEILVAGGSIDGGFGSHIIKLEYFGGITAEQLPFNFYANSASSTITAIEVSPLNTDIIYVSTGDGSFFTSTDGGQTFDSGYNSINNGHYLYGTSIYASRINENELWIAGSGYNNDGVFYSDDYGKNFSLFTDGLPSTLVFEITANAAETQFYAATETGPYVYLAETEKWEDLSQGNAPQHTYWSVEYLEEEEIVRYGTYGRGIWDFEFKDPIINVSTKELVAFEFASVYPNPVQDILNIKQSNPIQDDHVQMELYDFSGKLMLQSSLQSMIDMSAYPAGNYSLRITDQDRFQVEQIIKL